MESRKPNTQNRPAEPETLAGKQSQLLDRAARRERAMLGAWVGVTAIALVAMMALLEGCGQGSGSTKSVSDAREAASPPQQLAVASSEGSQAQAALGEAPVQWSESAVDLGSVPPDAVASVSDTFVTAGQAIEVTAEATPDVTEMALSDGRGDAIPMVRDSTGNVWRVHYRVPLRPRTDRLGLAVTAKNESHRWRRVWLFLHVDDGRLPPGVETPEEGGETHK